MELELPAALVEAYLLRRLVIVAGPRVSGAPTDAGLAGAVLSAFRARPGRHGDAAFLERMQQRLAEGLVARVLGELRRADVVAFTRSVQAAFGEPPSAPLADAITALAPMLQLVVTADLGRRFDIAFRGHWPEFMRPPLDRPRHYLFKLRGMRHDVESWVLTSDDVDRAQHVSSGRRRFLEGLLRFSTVLFLDFAARDPEFAGLRAALRSESGAERPHHFAYFTDESCDIDDQRSLEDDGIQVLSPPVGGDERCALALLGALARAQAESAGVGPRRSEVHDILAFVRGGPAPEWRGDLLVFTANGHTASRVLDIEDELRGIRELLRHKPLRLDISPAASLAAVVRDLFDVRPTIAHFSAHGSANGELLLREGDGTRPIAPQEIARTLEMLPVRPRLVTFCACYSDELARAAAQHVDFAIGFTDELPDSDAAKFSQTLYERLVAGQDVPTAFAAAGLVSATTAQAQLYRISGANR